MKPEYRRWIDSYLKDRSSSYADGTRSVRGHCHGASREMVAAFPELILCRGFVCGGGAHWWCKTADGEIVDPTASQFGYLADLIYDEYDLKKHGELPRGKCMNCGEYTYADSPDASICSEQCAVHFEEAMMEERSRWAR